MQNKNRTRETWRVAAVGAYILINAALSFATDPWLTYKGEKGAGSGKHIVLVSGDEEYRSEEALPMLARILSKHHGFYCTVLFAIDPETGNVNPNNQNNIPGLESLESADLMIIFTRFRALPDDQMQYIDDFLKAGKPVIGLRTATHAFQFDADSKWARYGNGYSGPKTEWRDGFGRLVLGEKWISHHGRHKHESTCGIIDEAARDHPIARGIKDGDIWGPTDVYGIRLPLPDDSRPIIRGQVMQRKGPYDDRDTCYGMRPDDGPPVEGIKNDPMMPIAWTKTYQIPAGKPGKAFTSTIAASTDLVAEGTRRLLVNATYWCLGMQDKIPPQGTNVDLVGDYKPTAYSGKPESHWQDLRRIPTDYR